MTYDRYDTRRGREYPRGSDFERGRRDERGFFERAGDEIASWFGDDDDRERNRPRDERWERDRERGFRPERSLGTDRDRDGERYRPLTGDYGRFEKARRGMDRSQRAWGRDEQRRTGSTGREHDRHYHELRQRQLDELDRDYDEYHRERQQHFENDFGSWRQTRQQKRQMLGQVREHMDVVGSDGEPIGKVDRVAGDRIILAKSDAPDGRHHSIPCTMIERVEGDRVMLGCTAEKAQQAVARRRPASARCSSARTRAKPARRCSTAAFRAPTARPTEAADTPEARLPQRRPGLSHPRAAPYRGAGTATGGTTWPEPGI